MRIRRFTGQSRADPRERYRLVIVIDVRMDCYFDSFIPEFFKCHDRLSLKQARIHSENEFHAPRCFSRRKGKLGSYILSLCIFQDLSGLLDMKRAFYRVFFARNKVLECHRIPDPDSLPDTACMAFRQDIFSICTDPRDPDLLVCVIKLFMRSQQSPGTDQLLFIQFFKYSHGLSFIKSGIETSEFHFDIHHGCFRSEGCLTGYFLTAGLQHCPVLIRCRCFEDI